MHALHSLTFLLSTLVGTSVSTTPSCATPRCPPGWTQGFNNKCMRLSAPATHMGCAAACAALVDDGNASLACVESLEDEQLAGMVAPQDFTSQVWLGEYQWPPEPVDFVTVYDCQIRNQSCDTAYKGQLNWGRCSNGAFTTATNGFLAAFQPNNFNGGEDCMARSMVGYSDNVCTEVLPCLCEWPSATAAEYLDVAGPALVAKSDEAYKQMSDKAYNYFGIGGALASLPALGFVLVVEGFFIRWRQRTAPATPEEAKLRNNQRLALRRRMLQSGLLLWIGCLLMCMAYVAERMLNESSWPAYGFGTCPWGHFQLWISLYMPGVFIAALSILPADTLAIRITAFGWGIFDIVDFTYFRWNGRLGQWVGATTIPRITFQVFLYWLWIILRAACSLAALRAAVFWKRHALPNRVALRWLWASIRVVGILRSVDNLNNAENWFKYPPWAPTMGVPTLQGGLITLIVSLIINPALRRRIQGIFGGFGKGASDASAAVVISSMVGGDPIQAMRSAEARLRCIRISKLTAADMANNQDSGLYDKVEKAKMGGVDAFLSHSWRDDGDLKWEKMLDYKAEFEMSHDGAEPLCWLDKACIDQSGDINASLRALPIFLLSSQCFVVLAGKSYTRRLWCVLEIFTFLRSGGTYGRIDVRPLDIDAAEAVALFDIRKADCFLSQDKHALLAIVESSYGSFTQFNTACRKILLAKLGSGEGAMISELSEKSVLKAASDVTWRKPTPKVAPLEASAGDEAP